MSYTALMGFDFGTHRIGIAVGQAVTCTASALTTLAARDGIPDWAALGRVIEEWQPDAFVVGIALHMDGSESEMARRARTFGNRVSGRFGRPWHPFDERLSSFEAKEWADELGRGRHGRRPVVDDLAARLILQSWMESDGLHWLRESHQETDRPLRP